MKVLFISISILCLLLFASNVLAQGTITGSSGVCVGNSGSYTVSGSSATTGYNWSIPSGASIVGGAGTSSINVVFSNAGMGQFIGVTGNGVNTGFSVDVYGRPSGSGPISGPGSICPGQTGVTFSTSGYSDVAFYGWFATNGATITSGDGTSSITVSFPVGYTSGTIGVTPTGGPCPALSTITRTIFAGGAPPDAPGSISGAQTVSPGQTGVTYTVPPVSGATSYIWSVPSGASISSGFGTNTITVNFASSFTGGSISVRASNSTCTGPSSAQFPLSLASLPAAAGPISGPSSVCEDNTATFTVAPIANATSYAWSPSGGPVSFVGSSSGNTITLSFPPNSSTNGITLTVSGGNANGLGLASPPYTFTVYRKPATVSAISGPVTVCPGQNGVTYSVTAVVNATNYVWTTPFSGSGGASTSYTVNFPSTFTSGNISVMPMNGPCAAPTTVLAVSIPQPVATAGTISGPSTVGTTFTNVVYSVPDIANATGYVWSLPPGASIASGANTNRVTVNYSSSSTSGNISVYGTNCRGNGASSSISVTVIPPPGAAGAISGPSTVCEDNTATFSVAPIANATGYSWAASGGPVLVVGSSSNSTITYSFPPNSSTNGITITVSGGNLNGLGPVSPPVTLTVYRRPAAVSAISGPTVVCPGQSGVTYSVTPVVNATNYVWTTPSSGSGGTATSYTTNFSSTFTSGNISVMPMNGPCAAPTKVLAVSVPQPVAAAGTISGPSTACSNQNGVVYSVPAIANATGYVWSLPPGASIASGANTNSLTVNYSSSVANGNISVYGTNCVGNGTSASKAITVTPVPAAPSTIIGERYVCGTATSIVYTVNTVASATGYTWTVPAGATIVSGQNTRSITVNFSPAVTGGSIGVTAQNCSGSSALTSLALSVQNEVGGRGPQPSVDLVTGIMSASIPLFTCQDGDVAIPANLDYTASGVRVYDTDGFVGHNWSLSVQSYRIGREVRGLPDDYSITADARKGWLYGSKRTAVKNFTVSNDNNPSTCSDETANHTFLNSVGYNEDTEPDAFHVNGPGVSFEFYFDENRVPQVMPYQDVVISAYTAAGIFTSSTTSGPITSFTVVDNRGFKYTFSEVETMTESLQESNNYYLSRYSKMHKVEMIYTTSWRLTSVISPTYGTVTFSYKSVSTANNNLAADHLKGLPQYKYRFPNEFDYSNGYGGTYLRINYSRVSILKILDKISSPSMEAVFISAPKNTDTSDERINSINIFEKRNGTSTLIRSLSFQYTAVDVSPSAGQPLNYRARTYLSGVHQTAGCFEQDHTFEYYGNALPPFSSKDKDDWGFHSPYHFWEPHGSHWGQQPYDETVIGGTLKRINYPYKGYDVFFYEPHDYWNGTATVQGGGIRLRKMISYDGVSTDNNIIKEYEYKKEDGISSGKLQYKASHRFNVAVLHKFYQVNIFFGSNNWLDHARYQQIKDIEASYMLNTDNIYRVKSEDPLDHYSMFHGSVVAYERVAVKQKDGGKTAYDFDLPASYGDQTANNGEWQTNKVLIARPSTGGSNCFQIHNVEQGANVYPFPPNPSYDFAKGLLKKETSFNEAGIKVKDVVYNYQRVYGDGSGIKKIFGLAIEELPTYYKNGTSYVDNTMYLFSKYEIYTGVKSELSSTVETVYNSPDLLSKTVKSTNFSYNSANHRELTRVVTTNSDGSQSATTLKYVKDYTITTPSGTSATALAKLKTANRNGIVETMNSRVSGVTEKYTSASLMLYQALGEKVYPHKQYTFHSSAGTTAFVPSSIVSGSTFKFEDTKYILDRTFLSFDNYGNMVETVGKDRRVSTIITGFNGTVPIININDAGTNDFKYSDFDAVTNADFFLTWGTPTYSTGRNNTRALNLPAGSESINLITNSFPYNKISYYTFSCWIKAASAGSFSVLTGMTTTATYTFSFTASADWKFYSWRVPIDPIRGTGTMFYIKAWSNVAIQVDDMAFYPETATFIAYSYHLPFGKKSETDSRGNSRFYEYDPWGRLRVVYDREKNITNMYEFKTRP